MQPGSLVLIDEHACISDIVFFDDHAEIYSLKLLQFETVSRHGILGTLLAICDAKKIKYVIDEKAIFPTLYEGPPGDRDTLESERQFCLVFLPSYGAVWLRRTFCSDM